MNWPTPTRPVCATVNATTMYQEILNAGIDVYSTVNIQHLESLNDVIQQITGVTVRETIPDSMVDQAAEIELVDLPTGELLQRLQDGKVYVSDQAARALEKFFRKGNLTALRELWLDGRLSRWTTRCSVICRPGLSPAHDGWRPHPGLHQLAPYGGSG